MIMSFPTLNTISDSFLAVMTLTALAYATRLTITQYKVIRIIDIHFPECKDVDKHSRVRGLAASLLVSSVCMFLSMLFTFHVFVDGDFAALMQMGSSIDTRFPLFHIIENFIEGLLFVSVIWLVNHIQDEECKSLTYFKCKLDSCCESDRRDEK